MRGNVYAWKLMRAGGRWLLLVIGLGLTVPPWPVWAQGRTLYQKESLYHRITVQDQADVRYLFFDRMVQNTMDLNDPTKSPSDYVRYMELGLLFNPRTKNALLIGLGGGSLPKKLLRDYPQLAIDAVELDPEVVRVAKQYFHIQEDGRFKIFVDDGRMFLRRGPWRYDLVFLDAYYADGIPFHLATKEFLLELRTRLHPNAVVVSNIISALSGPQSKLVRSMLKTLGEVFPQVYIFPAGERGERSDRMLKNIILIASNNRDRQNKKEVLGMTGLLKRQGFLPGGLSAVAASYVEEAIPIDDVPVLTDDYAPVDKLLHGR